MPRRGSGSTTASSPTVIQAFCRLALLALVACGAPSGGPGAPRQDVSAAGPQIDGLSGAVEILRDNHGIPHIYARSPLDAYAALGYAHAQDRLWQMEAARRTASGTLSEIVGPATRDADRFFRTLGLTRVAAENLAQLDAASRAVVAAYTRGVNAYLAAAPALPMELAALQATPQPWTPVDTIACMKMLAWTLSANAWDELQNVRLARRLTPAQVADLFHPPDDDEALPPAPSFQAAYGDLAAAASALTEAVLGGAAHGTGSNAWAVDGAHTASGKPLLANDPHLGLSAPAIWYVAHLHAPGLNAVGATIPGIPTVILGRNDRVAWGYTNTRPDTQDFYVERLVDGARYQTPGGPAAFATRAETIHVRGQPDEVLQVRISRHGPVVSDAVAAVRAAMPAGHALALSWVGLRPDDRTLQFTVHAATARSGADLRAAVRDFHAPQEVVVYADVDGDTGLVAAGRVPVRRADNDARGRVPQPGWDARYDWTGLIAFDELPQRVGGVQVSANQRITPPGYRHWMTDRWPTPDRAERIGALLASRPRHTLDDLAAIQLDVHSPRSRALLPTLLRAVGDDPIAARLRAWDGAMAPDRAEPLIYVEWIRQLSIRLAQERLGPLFAEIGESNLDLITRVLADRAASARWCAAAGCADEIRGAWRDALARLRDRHGADPAAWRWGDACIVVSANAALGGVPGLAEQVNVTTPARGGTDTVNNAGHFFDPTDGRYVVQSGPVFRALYDLADLEASRFMLTPGQSGDPASPQYRDLAPLWAEGRYLPLITERDTVLAGPTKRLVLSPR